MKFGFWREKGIDGDGPCYFDERVMGLVLKIQVGSAETLPFGLGFWSPWTFARENGLSTVVVLINPSLELQYRVFLIVLVHTLLCIYRISFFIIIKGN